MYVYVITCCSEHTFKCATIFNCVMLNAQAYTGRVTSVTAGGFLCIGRLLGSKYLLTRKLIFKELFVAMFKYLFALASFSCLIISTFSRVMAPVATVQHLLVKVACGPLAHYMHTYIHTYIHTYTLAAVLLLQRENG